MLNKTSLQVIDAFRQLATLEEEECLGAKDIAIRIKAPQNYLGKLFQQFVGWGLLGSKKGAGGGFYLRKSPKKITLFDIVSPIEHMEKWNGCILKSGKCSDKKPCPAHKRWDVVRTGYLSFLKETSLSDVLD